MRDKIYTRRMVKRGNRGGRGLVLRGRGGKGILIRGSGGKGLSIKYKSSALENVKTF